MILFYEKKLYLYIIFYLNTRNTHIYTFFYLNFISIFQINHFNNFIQNFLQKLINKLIKKCRKNVINKIQLD